jgi:hypothetical protein
VSNDLLIGYCCFVLDVQWFTRIQVYRLSVFSFFFFLFFFFSFFGTNLNERLYGVGWLRARLFLFDFFFLTLLAGNRAIR